MLGLVITIHIFVAILIVGLILLQQGKGANMGTSFGSGGSQTVFGSRGAAPFMFKLTVALVTIFFVTSVSLSYIDKKNVDVDSISGVSQIDYQKQRIADQALIEQSQVLDSKKEKGLLALQNLTVGEEAIAGHIVEKAKARESETSMTQ